MAVYVDPLMSFEARDADSQAFRVGEKNRHRWCHLFTDGDVAELHALAVRIGLRLSWFQRDKDGGHYDLTPGRRAAAVRCGAREVDRQRAVRIWHANRARLAAEEEA